MGIFGQPRQNLDPGGLSVGVFGGVGTVEQRQPNLDQRTSTDQSSPVLGQALARRLNSPFCITICTTNNRGKTQEGFAFTIFGTLPPPGAAADLARTSICDIAGAQ